MLRGKGMPQVMMRKSGKRIVFRYLQRKEHAEPGGKFRRKSIRPTLAQSNHSFRRTRSREGRRFRREENAESAAIIEGSVGRQMRREGPISIQRQFLELREASMPPSGTDRSPTQRACIPFLNMVQSAPGCAGAVALRRTSGKKSPARGRARMKSSRPAWPNVQSWKPCAQSGRREKNDGSFRAPRR